MDDEEEALDSGAKGKQGELLVFSELIGRGYNLYLPMVDSGIDCLVDVGEGNYKEVQIKYREDTPIFHARKFKPRHNFFIVCCLNTRRGNSIWVIPSQAFHNRGRPINVRGREYIQLRIGKEGSESYEDLREFYDNFNKLLTGATSEVRKAVKHASQKVPGPHFAQSDFEREVLMLLAHERAPLESREIIERLKHALKDKFSKADLELLKRGRLRWEATARFGIYQGLKPRGLIEAKSKNQWVITDKGKEFLSKLTGGA